MDKSNCCAKCPRHATTRPPGCTNSRLQGFTARLSCASAWRYLCTLLYTLLSPAHETRVLRPDRLVSAAPHMSCWPDAAWPRHLGRTGSQSSSAHVPLEVPAALSRSSHDVSRGSSAIISIKSVGMFQGYLRRSIRAVAEKRNTAPQPARPRPVPRKAEPTGPTCATRAVTLAARCTRLVGYTPAPRTLSVQSTGYGSLPPRLQALFLPPGRTGTCH